MVWGWVKDNVVDPVSDHISDIGSSAEDQVKRVGRSIDREANRARRSAEKEASRHFSKLHEELIRRPIDDLRDSLFAPGYGQGGGDGLYGAPNINGEGQRAAEFQRKQRSVGKGRGANILAGDISTGSASGLLATGGPDIRARELSGY